MTSGSLAFRYVHNPAAHIVHDRENLDERCNTDQIAQAVRKPGIMEGFDYCQWCFPARGLLEGMADGELGFRSLDSSNIIQVDYVQLDRSLFVHFVGGAIYRYENVDEDIFHRLRAAPSVGQAFDRLVKRGNYSFIKLEVGNVPANDPPADPGGSAAGLPEPVALRAAQDDTGGAGSTGSATGSQGEAPQLRAAGQPDISSGAGAGTEPAVPAAEQPKAVRAPRAPK